MSRAYRVELRTATRKVHSKDEIGIDLSILGILPSDEMKGLLEEALLEDGWAKTAGAKLVRRFGDVIAEIDRDKKTVTVHLEKQTTVSGRGASASAAEEEAKRRAEREKAGLDREVTRELAEREASVRESVQGALQRVYITALEKKARAMGEVESIDRREIGDGEVEIVIKVKV
jgi:hypothetical protein